MHPYFGRSVPVESLSNSIPCWNWRKWFPNVNSWLNRVLGPFLSRHNSREMYY